MFNAVMKVRNVNRAHLGKAGMKPFTVSQGSGVEPAQVANVLPTTMELRGEDDCRGGFR